MKRLNCNSWNIGVLGLIFLLLAPQEPPNLTQLFPRCSQHFYQQYYIRQSWTVDPTAKQQEEGDRFLLNYGESGSSR